MNQLDEGTQANAASSEEIAASSEEISAQADQMKKLVDNLSHTVLGTTAHGEQNAEHTGSRFSLNPAKPTAKVIKFQTKKPSASKFSVAKKTQNSAAETIPFDDDNDGRGKVGTTDGF
jgi:hypothetical protein